MRYTDCMCGRFAQSQPVIEYAKALDPAWKPEPVELEPTWNMAPSRRSLVFHDGEAGHIVDLFHWGFLPSWAEPKAQKPNNARVETAATKPYFRKAWKSGRCLIPADGWYEWKSSLKSKQPFFLHRADDEPMLMAGLFEINPHLNITSFAMLTTEADGALREVHDRKPVVLSADAGMQWIKRDLSADKIAEIAHNPLTAELFAWHEVSSEVNNAKNDGAVLILPTP